MDAIRAADAQIIDTAGINPFDEDEMQSLRALATAVDAELILVLAAGADAMESVDTARAFAASHAIRVIEGLELARLVALPRAARTP